MKILFLDAYFTPEAIPFSHLENDLIEGIVAKENQIFVVCPTPTRGISADVVKKYRQIKHETMYDGRVFVRRFRAPKERKNPIMRALRYLWCNMRQYSIAKKYKDIDVIFSTSTPPTQGVLGAKVAKKLSKKYKRYVPFVYNLQDIFPDSLVTTNLAKKGGILWKIGRKIENYTYKKADKIIVISESFKQNIIDKGVPEEKIEVVSNWIDTDSVYPVSREENILFDRYGLDRSKFYITHCGNIGHTQNLPLIIEIAKRLESENSDVRLLFVGNGAMKEELVASVERERLTNIILLPYQPYSEISHVFSLGDAGLVISKKGVGTSCVPSKTWSIMACNKPVIASFDTDSDLAHVINDANAGFCVEPDNTELLVNAIRECYKNRQTDTCKNREYIMKNVAKDVCVGKYIEVLEEEYMRNRNEG